ncbi:hypothetical protein ACFC1R_21090 [Kitasatospora sp. NPDC056138]
MTTSEAPKTAAEAVRELREIAHWWAAEIAGGWLDPVAGAGLIIENVAGA